MVRRKVTRLAHKRMPLKRMQQVLGPKALELYVQSGGAMSNEQIALRLGVRKAETIRKWLKAFRADEILLERDRSPIAAAELMRKILFDRIQELAKSIDSEGDAEDAKKFEPGDADALHKLTHVYRAVKGDVDAKEAWSIFVASFGGFVHDRNKDDPEYLARVVGDMRAFGEKILVETLRDAA